MKKKIDQEKVLRVAAQQLRIRQLEAGKDGRRAKGRARLAATVGAVADVQGERLRERRLEADGATLALRVHLVSVFLPCHAMGWLASRRWMALCG